MCFEYQQQYIAVILFCRSVGTGVSGLVFERDPFSVVVAVVGLACSEILYC